jgi:hypothetical protein
VLNSLKQSLFVSVAVFYFLVPSALADSGVTPNTPAWSDEQARTWQFAKHAGTEEKAEAPVKEPGADAVDNYTPTQQGGTTSDNDQLTESDHQAPTDANKQMDNQSVPHDFIQKEFTEYSNPMLNNYGPPKYPLPFRHTLPHNPNPNNDSLNPATFTDNPGLKGAPASDLVSHENTLVAAQRAAEQLINPSFQTHQAELQGGVQGFGESTSAASGAMFNANIGMMNTYLPNVANENTGTPTSSDAPKKTLEQAIWMVQQMFSALFLPMAYFFVIPGAVITQWSSLTGHGFLSESHPTPFTGILRGLVAIFLIPATQLIVSWSIDVGNSLTYEVMQQVKVETITAWATAVNNPTSTQSPADQDKAKREQSTMQAMMQGVLSSANMLLNNGLMILRAYQTVMACYLLLLGPLAASFFAWPDQIGRLFKPVFGNWLDGLLNLVLWQFWWSIIILCMATRLQWLAESGQPVDGPFEAIVFAAFMVMLTYIPFMALDFKTREMVDKLLEKTQAGGTGGEARSGGGSRTAA